MAGLQIGDFVTFSRLAWRVYQYGWTDEYSGTKQYTDFGSDVRGLAQSLDILSDVVAKAQNSLHQQGPPNALVRWDPVSLGAIVGDYQATLAECHKLIDDNYRYNTGRSAVYSITWNALLQPAVDTLRQRIQLHNSKLLLVLKPFEIDILCRVREDIKRVHNDLALRITALHVDLHRLMGVVVPDLDVTLKQQAAREIRLLQVPPELSERFRLAALVDHPYHDNVDAFRLQELSDAFVLNYRRSTIDFQGGFVVAARVPSLQEYLNLLKCVWLLKTMRSSRELPTAQSTSPANSQTNSHWPSYVSQLEDDLSTQCYRFDGELVPPQISPEALTRDLFTIWPEQPTEQLVDVVTQDELMELLVEVPLESSAINVDRNMKLLRRLDSGARRFRIVISGAERPATTRSRQQTEVIDFDITTHILQPQYALPFANGATRDFILRRDERVARLSFTTKSHLMKFQQAITGYKPFSSWTQSNALVSFIREGQKDPVTERACIQLWLPRSLDGSFVTNADIDTSFSAAPSRSTTMASTTNAATSASGPGVIPITGGGSRSNTLGNPDGLSASPDYLSSSPKSRQTSLPSGGVHQSYGQPGYHVSSQSWHTASPPLMGLSPPRGPGVGFAGGPVSASAARTPRHPSSPNLQNGFLGPPIPKRNGNGRSQSISSGVSHAPTNASNSSGSDVGTATVSVGANGLGTVHRRQAKPLLVIFAQSMKNTEPSFVTVELDERTAVNPERCDCRQSSRVGKQCPIASIEQNKGASKLVARRFELPAAHGEMEWNMGHLASSNPTSSGSKTIWKNLTRVSIMFPEGADRHRFSGTPSDCRCKNKNMTVGELSQCLAWGHQGYLGEVLEYHRRKGHEYHRSRNASVDVQYGLPP